MTVRQEQLLHETVNYDKLAAGVGGTVATFSFYQKFLPIFHSLLAVLLHKRGVSSFVTE